MCAFAYLPHLYVFSLGLSFSPSAFYKHADKGIGDFKLSLGANEVVKV